MFSGNVDDLPDECFRADDDGTLPTCTSDGQGGWEVSYPGGGPGDPGGGFALLVVLVLLGGVALTVWKVSAARRMARGSGMDEGDATTMALLTDDGLEATYLASNLRHRDPGDGAPDGPRAGAADRLRELEALLDQGLVTEEEYAAARRSILDSL